MNRVSLILVLVLSTFSMVGCPDDGGDLASDDGNTTVTDAGADAVPDGPEDATPQTGFPMLEFVHIETGPDQPIEATSFHFLPDAPDELLVLEKDGFVSHYRLDGDSASRLERASVAGVKSELDCGLLSLAIDPDFATNRYIYLGYCTSATHNIVVRATWELDSSGELASEPVTIIEAGDSNSQFFWHNIGTMAFEEDGVLWMLWGDKRVSSNAQKTDNVLGGLARIIPSREVGVGGYEPAPGNPFAEASGGHPALWAWGLRAPWRGGQDRYGRYWVADVGENDWEELNLVTGPSQNFGWPHQEGICTSGCDGFVDPIAQYSHEDTEPYVLDDDDAEPIISRAIWVSTELQAVDGDPYEGRLDGHLLMGDFCSGFVRAMMADEEGALVVDKHIGHLANVTEIEQHSDGTLFLSVYGACKSKTPADPPGGLYRAVMAGP